MIFGMCIDDIVSKTINRQVVIYFYVILIILSIFNSKFQAVYLQINDCDSPISMEKSVKLKRSLIPPSFDLEENYWQNVSGEYSDRRANPGMENFISGLLRLSFELSRNEKASKESMASEFRRNKLKHYGRMEDGFDKAEVEARIPYRPNAVKFYRGSNIIQIRSSAKRNAMQLDWDQQLLKDAILKALRQYQGKIRKFHHVYG